MTNNIKASIPFASSHLLPNGYIRKCKCMGAFEFEKLRVVRFCKSII